MRLKEYLPIGSVVLLNNAKKKLVITGIMQISSNKEQAKVYDYLGVPYPEGYVGAESGFLFYHKDIQEVLYRGYTDDERRHFIEFMQNMIDQTEKTMSAE